MKNIVKIIISLPVMLFIASGCGASREDDIKNELKSAKHNYAIYVSKADLRLYIYDRSGKVVSSYKIAYGMNPDKKAKLYAGDNRTPEGRYKITEIWSMDAGHDSPAYKNMKKYNEIYFRCKDGHCKYGKPYADLGDNAYGPRFYLLDYPNNVDIARYKKALSEGKIPGIKGSPAQLGAGIAIHGNNDEESIGHLASSGCIRMYNNDIIEIEKYIGINTPVIIVAD